MTRCRTFLLAVLLVAIAGTPGRAAAHAVPVSYDPASDAVLQLPPEELRIDFTERIESQTARVTVIAPDGSRVERDGVRVPDGAPRTVIVPVDAAARGTYTVAWSVISADDGHFTKGAYLFSVGDASQQAGQKQASYQVVHSSPVVEAFAVWVELLGQAVIAGALLLWWLLRSAPLDGVWKRLRVLLWVGTVFVVVGALTAVYAKTAELSLLLNLPFSTSLEQYMTTTAGMYALARAVIAMGIACLSTLLSAPGVRYYEWTWIALLYGISILARARVSHAAATDLWPGFAIAMNAVHLLAKQLWIGGVVAACAALIGPLERKGDAALTARTLTRFSVALAAAGGMAGVTGCFIVALHLKSVENIAATHWGMQFLLLSLVAVFLLLMRCYNALIEDRLLVRAARGAVRQQSSLGVTLGLEALLGAVVLYLSATLVITTPPLRDDAVYSETRTDRAGAITLALDAWDVSRVRLDVSHADVASLVVTLTNAEQGIGPVVVDTEMLYPGGYAFPRSRFAVPGEWQVQANAVRPGAFDVRGSWTLRIPEDVTPTTAGLNSLRIACIMAVLLLAAVFARLARASRALAALIPAQHAADASHLHIVDRSVWSVAPVVLIVLQFAGVFSHRHDTATAFAAHCSQNGHVWMESAPIRDGRPTSRYARLGCTLGSGQALQHFVDAREYEAYVAPRKLTLFLEHPQPLLVGEPSRILLSLHDASGAHMPLIPAHERIAHVIAVDDRFRFFAHVHPEESAAYDGSTVGHELPVDITFPRPGKYLVGGDVLTGAQNVQQQYTMIVPGADAPQPPAVYGSSASVGSLRITLSGADELRAGVPGTLSFRFEDGDGPVEDLQPYLGAFLHLAVVGSDLQTFSHQHGELPLTWLQWMSGERPGQAHLHGALPPSFGPRVDVPMRFVSPGTYYLFLQAQRAGRVITAPFMVEVR